MAQFGRRLGSLVPAALLAAALLEACTSSPAGTSAATFDPFGLAGAPAEVRNRMPLLSCGTEVGHPPEGFNVKARTCFWTAYTRGLSAEFISTRPAANGQPIVVIWRSLGGGHAEFFVDEAATTLPGHSWTHTTCPKLTLTNDPHVAPDWVPGIFGAGCTTIPMASGS